MRIGLYLIAQFLEKFPSGSTFKLVVASAALQEKLLTKRLAFYQVAAYVLANGPFLIGRRVVTGKPMFVRQLLNQLILFLLYWWWLCRLCWFRLTAW